MPNLEQAVGTLTNLKGVGTTLASGIIARARLLPPLLPACLPTKAGTSTKNKYSPVLMEIWKERATFCTRLQRSTRTRLLRSLDESAQSNPE